MKHILFFELGQKFCDYLILDDCMIKTDPMGGLAAKHDNVELRRYSVSSKVNRPVVSVIE